jgi:hypothetical protein
MRWGICFLLWVGSAIYLVDSCLDLVRVWQNPPPGYTREMVLPHLKRCGRQRGMQFAGVTVGLVGLYWATGWALRRRSESRPRD